VRGELESGIRIVRGIRRRTAYRVGHELVDEFLKFASLRCRPSTVRAYAHDLKVFFGFVGKEPAEVSPKDVVAFIAD
jgi:hypothetical protein